MAERGITSEMIGQVVEDATVTVRRSDGCTEYTGTVQGQYLKVVVDERRDPHFIRMVHWVEEQGA